MVSPSATLCNRRRSAIRALNEKRITKKEFSMLKSVEWRITALPSRVNGLYKNQKPKGLDLRTFGNNKCGKGREDEQQRQDIQDK